MGELELRHCRLWLWYSQERRYFHLNRYSNHVIVQPTPFIPPSGILSRTNAHGGDLLFLSFPLLPLCYFHLFIESFSYPRPAVIYIYYPITITKHITSSTTTQSGATGIFFFPLIHRWVSFFLLDKFPGFCPRLYANINLLQPMTGGVYTA